MPFRFKTAAAVPAAMIAIAVGVGVFRGHSHLSQHLARWKEAEGDANHPTTALRLRAAASGSEPMAVRQRERQPAATHHPTTNPSNDAFPEVGVPMLPSSLAENRTHSDPKYDPPHPKNSFLLRRSDSLYRKYNISTTPIVIETYKLLFFGVEKIGSTVLKQLMRRMMGYEDYWLHRDGIPHTPKSGLKFLTDYSLENANRMMTSDEWTRAMFVRDPKERVLSAYLMWRPKSQSEKEIAMAERGMLNESVVKRTALGKCCKNLANANANHEVLCLKHMQKFDDFLEMLENPVSDGDHDSEQGARHNSQNKSISMISRIIRKSAPCPNKHWSPITQWRMERKFYPKLNFIGHLESAQWDVKRLLDKLHPEAWEKYGTSGWGRYRNESMFRSSGTVHHAKKAENHLLEYYTSKEIERRVEKIYEEDYENEVLDLVRVPVGDAQSFYEQRFLERYGAAATEQGQ